MEWYLTLLIIFFALLILMATGMPIAFCFMLINIVGVYCFFGGIVGLEQLIESIYTSLATFVLLPIALFVLMGELVFQSGIGALVIDVLDKWLGRLPGRLSLLAVIAGTLFATLIGVSVASTALLGSTLVPEMEKRGYKKPMSLGPILGSGGLAIMIPPSSYAIVLGAIGQISIGKILIAIIVPGFLMAVLYTSYIIGRCKFQPGLAPAYEVIPVPLSKKLLDTVRYVLPLGIVFFLAVGVIFLGIATPSEAAATAAVGISVLLLFYRRLSLNVLKITIIKTLKISGMMFLIIAGAKAFSQILAFSGASAGLTDLSTSLPIAPVGIVIAMQIVILILGAFMDGLSIMMVTLPIFVPAIMTLGFDPVWFGVIYLLNIEMAMTTPPFGMGLFVMKGVAPAGTTFGEICRAALPFLYCDTIAMGLIIVFPSIALWLPGLMR